MKLAVAIKDMGRAINSATSALGFRRNVTFKQVERKLFEVMAAGPSSRKWKKIHAYFEAVVKPYVDLALLIDAADRVRDEIKSQPRRLAQIRNEARKLAAVRDERRLSEWL